jgi:hypothetical protein
MTCVVYCLWTIGVVRIVLFSQILGEVEQVIVCVGTSSLYLSEGWLASWPNSPPREGKREGGRKGEGRSRPIHRGGSGVLLSFKWVWLTKVLHVHKETQKGALNLPVYGTGEGGRKGGGREGGGKKGGRGREGREGGKGGREGREVGGGLSFPICKLACSFVIFQAINLLTSNLSLTLSAQLVIDQGDQPTC